MFEALVSIIVAMFYGISATIQKYSLIKMKKFSMRKIIRNKKWLASLSIGLVGVLTYLFALRFVKLTTIQPILALSIIIPIVSGVIFFNEKLSRLEWLSVFLIIIGVTWVSIV